ncbi:MAG: hypothetical protein JXR37_14685 [Kiritimatiellae bacterium]|nr:hypothetical protein [Kiritimatiellia bacterium]
MRTPVHGWPEPAARITSGAVLALVAWLVSAPGLEAGAPARAVPYAEAIARDDPAVFFCEDFEGGDLSLDGTIGDSPNKYWRNPALVRTELYWAVGGSHQLSTIPIPGFDSARNRVWRVTKSQSFIDIVTGRNPGRGSGSLGGWLDPAILGSGAREWYVRCQVYFHETHSWPTDYDFKVFFALPREFPDMPSAVYETGIFFHQDFACPVNGSWVSAGGNTPMIRYGPAYDAYPPLGELCPWLEIGAPADGLHMPRFAKGRWYTLEYHLKLSSSPGTANGLLELWVDGNLAYSRRNIDTCRNGCPDMGFVMIMGWMNPADPQTGYYEIDNVIMSRAYIGPPTHGDASAPAPPTGLKITSRN